MVLGAERPGALAGWLGPLGTAVGASMEPGAERRGHDMLTDIIPAAWRPQWSPALNAGGTYSQSILRGNVLRPQWSPALNAGGTG